MGRLVDKIPGIGALFEFRMGSYIKVEMWWLIGSAPDFWGRSPGFESGISYDDPGALHDHYVIL